LFQEGLIKLYFKKLKGFIKIKISRKMGISIIMEIKDRNNAEIIKES
jgi:hypothetical protein